MAQGEFQDVVHYYPLDDVAGTAQFYLGEIAYQQKDYATAINDYNAVLEGFSGNAKAPAAQLHKGFALIAKDKRDEGDSRVAFADPAASADAGSEGGARQADGDGREDDDDGRRIEDSFQFAVRNSRSQFSARNRFRSQRRKSPATSGAFLSQIEAGISAVQLFAGAVSMGTVPSGLVATDAAGASAAAFAVAAALAAAFGTLLWWRTSAPCTQKMTSSAMLVA